MTVKYSTPTARLSRSLMRALMLALLVAGLSATPALAQEDQAYKTEFNAGLEAYKAKNVNEAYTHWVKAADLAKQAGDSDVASKSLNYVSQIDYARGIDAYKKEQYEDAIKHFETGLEHDPSYAKHYYGKGLALKKLDRMEEATAAFKEAMEQGDGDVASTAEEALRSQYIFLASSALARGGENATRSDAQEAISHLQAMEEHVELDADAYYYMAEAYKALGQNDQAVAAADKGLELHRGSRSDKAKLYFVKGEALMFMGNNAEAANAFREARFGSFKAPAEHYLETLGTGGGSN